MLTLWVSLRGKLRLTGQNAMANARFENVWTKLRAFELVEYDRVVLVDSDMLVKRNMDELMLLGLGRTYAGPRIAAASACTCNPDKVPSYPSNWVPENCAYTPQTFPECLMQPTPVTDTSPPTYRLLNSGLVVIDPSVEQGSALQRFISTEPTRVSSYHFPDQELLADVYTDRYIPLPWIYNALKTLRRCHAPLWADEEVRNVHYILQCVCCEGSC